MKQSAETNGAKPVKERNHSVDFLKCLACFSVVMLHYPTHIFGKEITMIQVMLGRCGVPVFLMISGWFAGKKMNSKTKKEKKVKHGF